MRSLPGNYVKRNYDKIIERWKYDAIDKPQNNKYKQKQFIMTDFPSQKPVQRTFMISLDYHVLYGNIAGELAILCMLMQMSLEMIVSRKHVVTSTHPGRNVLSYTAARVCLHVSSPIIWLFGFLIAVRYEVLKATI